MPCQVHDHVEERVNVLSSVFSVYKLQSRKRVGGQVTQVFGQVRVWDVSRT